MDTNYNAQDNADLTSGLSSGGAHVMPSASIMKGGLASLSFIEIALLAGAGFVIFRNRERIEGFLEEQGIDLQGLMGKARDLLQSKQSGGESNDSNESESTQIAGRSGRGGRRSGRGSNAGV